MREGEGEREKEKKIKSKRKSERCSLPRGKTIAENNEIDKKDKIKTDKTSKINVKQNKLNRFTAMVCNNVQSGRIAADFCGN